jgi:hypothetical protein
MKHLLYTISLLVLITGITNAQTFTRGGAAHISWKWRPDIADSCYEFTFVNYIAKSYSGLACI